MCLQRRLVTAPLRRRDHLLSLSTTPQSRRICLPVVALWVLPFCVSILAAVALMAQQLPLRQRNERASPAVVRSITLHWDQVPLREATMRLSDALRRAIFVDRRVDPSRRIDLSLREVAPQDVLERLATELSLGVSQWDGVVYLGPPPTAAQLRTVAAICQNHIRQLPPDRRRVLLHREPRSWPRFTEPRRLVVDLLAEQGWAVRNAELIPHDLWPAGQLPALGLGDQLTLLLAGFDLTFVPLADQRAIEIQPIDNPVVLRKRYRWPESRGPELSVLRQKLPDATLQVEGRRLVVAGRLEDHERLLELLGRRSDRSDRGSAAQNVERRYTLRVDNQPVGVVLRELGRQLAWNVRVDEAAIQAAGRSLDRRVSFAVEDATLDELLESMLQPAGLTHRRNGQQLIVTPLPESD